MSTQQNDKQQNKNITESFRTPKGRATFPHVNTPDTFMNSTKYKADLILDPNDSEVSKWMSEWTKKAEAFFDKTQEGAPAKQQKKMFLALPWDDHYEDDEPTGDIRVKISCSGNYAPAIFDANNNRTSTEVKGGSLLEVVGKAAYYGPMGDGRTGVAFSRMSAVKIHSGSGSFDPNASAQDYGFDGPQAETFEASEGGPEGDDTGGDF
jgi:hypothetical protein